MSVKRPPFMPWPDHANATMVGGITHLAALP